MTLDQIEHAIAAAGLAPRGALALDQAEQVGPLEGCQRLVLVGLVGRTGWDSFAHIAEFADGLPDPLDRWSTRCITALADQLDAHPLFPFGGPPYWPFQRWARRAEPLHPSPLGLLIHPVHGLWHSYRGALAFAAPLDLPPLADAPSPCAGCHAKPCLTACPVSAYGPHGFAVESCTQWLRSAGGRPCMDRGCRARAACPVGTQSAHQADQASFGMRAFLAAHD